MSREPLNWGCTKDGVRSKIVRKDFAKALDDFLDQPCFDRALGMIRANPDLAVFFHESKPGGMYYRQFKQNQ